MTVGRHEVGDHGLGDRAAERPERTREDEQGQPAPLRAGGEQERDRIADHDALSDEDNRASADAIREVATQESTEPGQHRADEERERQLALGPELLDCPDGDEAPERRPGSGADHRRADDGTKRGIEVVAPDQPHQTTDDAHRASEASQRPSRRSRHARRSARGVSTAISGGAGSGSRSAGASATATPRSRSRSKSPRSAADISSLWLCSFTRPVGSPPAPRLLPHDRDEPSAMRGSSPRPQRASGGS